ncbi:phytanoyl-CoA dioxygenase family protein, partial [Candidatus Pelagibacter sp.]|uniref:phytanoyl-CoA dioxygenase family protein n=1 Tax=Candidatus Pelagibacter sp. TaxID=2024849 RepID=UPI003F83E79F
SESYFYRSRIRYFLFKKLINFQISKLIDCLTIIRLTKKLKLKNIANNVLGQKTKLTSIDSYFSKKSNKNVIDWHVDQAYSGRLNVENFVNPNFAALKFFVYLTSVDSDNGCLGYIPKTSKIAYQLKKDIYNKEIKYRPYWSLKDFRNVIKDESYRKNLEKKIDPNEIESFLNSTSFIEKEPYNTTKYDYKLDKGGALIFDESGVHRGSMPSKTDRLVIRFVYKISSAPD